VRRIGHDTSESYWAPGGPRILSYTWLAHRDNDEPSHQTRDSHSDDDGEREHDEPSVKEPSGTMENIRVPTEQNLSGSHHSVIPQVGQETPLQPAMHSQFLRFPKPEKFTCKSTDSNEVENWILVMDNLFVAQGKFLTENQNLAYAVGFLTEDALTWWLAERISPVAPHTWTLMVEPEECGRHQ
jgi:hypothetical protein